MILSADCVDSPVKSPVIQAAESERVRNVVKGAAEVTPEHLFKVWPTGQEPLSEKRTV